MCFGCSGVRKGSRRHEVTLTLDRRTKRRRSSRSRTPRPRTSGKSETARLRGVCPPRHLADRASEVDDAGRAAAPGRLVSCSGESSGGAVGAPRGSTSSIGSRCDGRGVMCTTSVARTTTESTPREASSLGPAISPSWRDPSRGVPEAARDDAGRGGQDARDLDRPPQ
jgi:hypothetical protein